MKKAYNIYISKWLLPVALFFITLQSCSKVDNHATLVANQPWLADHYSLAGFPNNEWLYPSSLIVGDTAVLIGKLFTGEPGASVAIGGVPVKVVDKKKLDPNGNSDNHGYPYPVIDLIRFVVTREMGVGTGRKVEVTANGNTIYGRPVAVREFAESSARTDTTLWVDRIGSWKPDNEDEYLRKGYALVRSVHNDRNGVVYFDNQLGVYKLEKAAVKNIIKPGDAFTDDKGAKFSIIQILGSTISFDGSTLYFSAENNENTADAVSNYIFRICKMDIATGGVTTINRTLVLKVRATNSEDGSPYTGMMDRLKIIAKHLNLDINNNLYFTNYYAPDNVSDDHSSWYAGISNGGATQESIPSSVSLVDKMTADGKVTAVMASGFDYTTPGFKVALPIYFPDLMGRYLHGFSSVDYVTTFLQRYDPKENDVLASIPNNNSFSFQSYEKNPAYRLNGTVRLGSVDINTIYYLFQPLLIMSDGTVLHTEYSSLFAYDLTDMRAYCYAGTETGYIGFPEEQNKETGKAKWVSFSEVDLIGQDKSNAVYYCKGYSPKTTPDGVIFYKLYSK
ncbi:MAG TPA: hypothetical protein VM802_09075 [Chitinophaga sp.]|uniref:hypothetical protein n=1 Tax=Chitinophaga sp. TaxID=1869181 RepID=UPI002C2C60B4|nr:hypothetical protein [Chitinophaga sp.]HVI45011.1 hypothetical protein [Chitinophaga sp.]